MADLQQVDLKALIGDGHSRVTVSKEISEKDYGRGGSVYVSVTFTCDQSEIVVANTAQWAGYLASKYAFEQHAELKQQLISLGLIQ
jgi:hypothetical protein